MNEEDPTNDLRTKVYGAFLRVLDQSPIWAWGRGPSLWSLANEDPAIISPFDVEIESAAALEAKAKEFMEQDLRVLVPGLFLVLEVTATERVLLATHRDGAMISLAHSRGDTEAGLLDVGRIDEDEFLAAMRLVGAVAYR